MDAVTLRTPRLELSVPTVDDIGAIFDACQDSAIQRYTTVPSPYERQHAEGFITFATQRWADTVEATWAIREAGALVGMVGINGITRGGSGELGYWMARTARGRGLLTEAATAVLDWGFSADGAGLARIEWRAVVGNIASARAGRALGFHLEGTQRQSVANTFGRHDGWIAALLPTDDRTPQPWPPLEA